MHSGLTAIWPSVTGPLGRAGRKLWSGQGLGPVLARGAAGSFGLNVASNVIALATAVLLARLLGPADYGVYALAMVYANLLGLAACLGFPQLIVRRVSQLAAEAQWTGIAGLLRTAATVAIVVATLLAAGGAGLAPRIVGASGPGAAAAFALAMVLVILIALQRIGETALLGFERYIPASLPERIVRPLAMLVATGVLALGMGGGFDAQAAIGAHIAAYGLSLAGAFYLIVRTTPAAWREAESRFDWQQVAEAAPLLAVALITILSARLDIMMLGWLGDAEDVGHYRFATQLATLSLMIATIAQSVVSPAIARAHGGGTLAAVLPTLRKLAAGSALAALALGVGIYVSFDVLLALIGPSFAPAREPLAILLVAYGLAAAVFYAHSLLMMSGHARDIAVSGGVALAVNGALNLILVPRYGATGAAWATLVSMVVLSAINIWNASRRLGIRVP